MSVSLNDLLISDFSTSVPRREFLSLCGTLEKLKYQSGIDEISMLTNDILNNNFYLSYSSISKYIISGKEYLNYRYGLKKPPTDKMSAGNLFEDLLFNNIEYIENKYLVCPYVEYRTNEAKASYTKYQQIATYEGKTLIKKNVFDRVFSAAQNAKNQIPQAVLEGEKQKKINTKILDVPIIGYIDISTENEIIDIKYTYNPENADNVYTRNWYMQMAIYYLAEECSKNCYIYAFSNAGDLHIHKISEQTLIEGLYDLKCYISDFLQWICNNQ